MVASRILAAAVLLVSGCLRSDDGGNAGKDDETLDVRIATDDQAVVGQLVELLAYIPGDGYQDLEDVSWLWNIESAPAGSAISLPDATGSFIEIVPDVRGYYLVRVEGIREGVGAGEATAVVEVFEYGVGLTIQLTWSTPEGDVDLHLVNLTESGVFGEEPFDCYYSNKSPDWPPAGPGGDPTLDVDDVQGFGPENISITETVPAAYRVFAHYFSDHGFGPTDATIRIALLDSALHIDTQTLPQTGAVWMVADVDTGLQTVTPIDVLTNDTAIGFAPASK